MKDIRKGDIIFSCYDKAIRAIGVATTSFYEDNRPSELVDFGQWNEAGYRVDVNYTVLENPIMIENIWDKMKDYRPKKYSAFQENGHGNQAYLFPCPEEWYEIFVRYAGFDILETEVMDAKEHNRVRDYNKNITDIKSSPWEINTDSNIAVKHLDKSAFLHNGTGIPKEVSEFFVKESLNARERIEINLFYNNPYYKAHIEMDSHRRTRMIWATDFSNVIRREYPKIYAKHNNGEEIDEEKPCLFFKRINDNEYEVKLSKLILLPQVEEDIESELSEEGINAELLKEGQVIEYYVKRYERNPQNRKRAIEIHGLNCVVCGFNFEKVYGERGKDFIEVHHVNPISTIKEEIEINPETDLVPVCSNCYRMIHRRKNEVLSIEELKKLLHQG